MAKPAEKKTMPAVAVKNRVFDALVEHVDGIADEGAQIAFLHSIGISDERDVNAVLKRANDDEDETA